MEIILSIIFGTIVGLSLGLTGGGGSIFAVPLLVYGIGLSPVQAVPVSLVTVAITALLGVHRTIRDQLLVWQPAIVFATGGIIGAPLGLMLSRQIEEYWIILGFAVLAMVVGSFMWKSATKSPDQTTVVRARIFNIKDGGPVCRLSPDGELRFGGPCAVVLTLVGLCTGILSGLFGVGGGFLIVPALAGITRMGIHRAVATSLVVITLIGFSGAASALWHGGIQWEVLFPFIAGGAIGMTGGQFLAVRLSGATLQKVFACVIVLVGTGMLAHMALVTFKHV